MKKLALLFCIAFSVEALALERCDIDTPNSPACNQPRPKPKPKHPYVFDTLDDFLDGVKNIKFCFNASEKTTDINMQSCIVFESNLVSILHSGNKNYFETLGVNWHPSLLEMVDRELYNFNFSSKKNIPSIKVDGIMRLKSIADKADDEPTWYIRELARCEAAYKYCANSAGFFQNWLKWFSYVAADEIYLACETGKPLCIKRVEKLRKISEDMIFQGMGRTTGGSGGGGSLGTPGGNRGGSGIAVGTFRCFGWNRVCYNGRECVRRWQEQICGR